MDEPYLPQDVDSLAMAFGQTALVLMPPMNKIPKGFSCSYNNKWIKFFNDWFFGGIKITKLTPKKGIDKNKALRHLKTIAGSFEPQHEHKEAAVAYLASLWFDDIAYERAKVKEGE